MAGSRTGSLLPSGSSRSDRRGSRANLCYTLLRPGEPQELVPDGAVALRGCSTHGAALPRGGMVTWEEERSLFSCPGCRGDPWVPVGPCIPVAAGQMCRAAAVLLGWKRQKQLHRAPCQDTPGTVLRVSASGATILSPCSCPAPPPPSWLWPYLLPQTGCTGSRGGRCCAQTALPQPPPPLQHSAPSPGVCPAPGLLSQPQELTMAPGTSSVSGSAPRALWGWGCTEGPSPGAVGRVQPWAGQGRAPSLNLAPTTAPSPSCHTGVKAAARNPAMGHRHTHPHVPQSFFPPKHTPPMSCTPSDRGQSPPCSTPPRCVLYIPPAMGQDPTLLFPTHPMCCVPPTHDKCT